MNLLRVSGCTSDAQEGGVLHLHTEHPQGALIQSTLVPTGTSRLGRSLAGGDFPGNEDPARFLSRAEPSGMVLQDSAREGTLPDHGQGCALLTQPRALHAREEERAFAAF